MIERKSLFVQSLILLFISIMVGLGVNSLRKNKLPLFYQASSHDLSIDISDAKRMFLKKEVLFIDARPKQFYEKVHIKGAINIPPEEMDSIEKMNLPKDKTIIVYCERKCELSKELAMELYSLGFDKVYYLKGGIDAWIAKGLPVYRP